MNYRTMVKGALALSLSLIVGSALAATTTQTDAAAAYAEDFEAVAVTNGMPITDAHFNALDLGDDNKPYGWLASEGDESKVIAGGPTGSTKALQLNTDAGTLTNQFQKSVRDSLNGGIDGTAGAGAYFETEVKFVPSDTLDAGIAAGTDATKFAIYAYADENAATTNLVIFHKYIDTNDDEHYTNEQFGAVNCDVYTKLRVEMKQMEDSGGTLVNVFCVKVNDGAALTSPLAFADGIWFLTAENTDVAANKKVSSLNFKGTGEIDNVKAGVITETTEYAITWTAQNATVTNAAGTTLTAADTNFLAGATLTFTPDTDMVITNVLVDGTAVAFDPASYTYTVGSADATVAVYAGTQSQQQTKPAWANDSGDGSSSDPYWTWAANHAAGQQLDAQGADYSAQYLMNIDANKTPILTIESIEVTAEGSKIVVSATDGTNAIDLDDINGVLNVSVGSSLSNLTSKSIPENNVTVANNKATVIIPTADGAFAKATVDFKAPENSSLTPVAAQQE